MYKHLGIDDWLFVALYGTVATAPGLPNGGFQNLWDGTKLEPAEAEKLQPVLEYLKKYTEKNAVISGYASTDGQKAYNQRLSNRRAKAVEKWLIDNGIDASRIKAEGKGEVDFGSRKDSRMAAVIQIE